MQLYLALLTSLLAATANAQVGSIFSSLTSEAGGAIESKVSSKLTGAAASYTGPGSNVVSSIASNPTAVNSVISKVESAAGGATSTGGANYNQAAQAGLGAVVVAGLFGMAA